MAAPTAEAGAETGPDTADAIDPRLQRAIWENIAELRLAEQQRRKRERTSRWRSRAWPPVVVVVLLLRS